MKWAPKAVELTSTVGYQERSIEMKKTFSLIGMLILLVCLLNVNSTIAQDVENLARGGDFEDATDMGKWNLNLGNAGVGTRTIDKKEAAIGKASLFISGINFDPAENWKPQIDQGNIEILENGVYTISAFLKAEEPRSVGMYAELLVDPWTKSPNLAVNVGTEWKEYWATGVPPAGTVGIGFSNQGSKVNYWIDGVRYYAGEYVPTKNEGGTKAVTPRSKLTTTWGSIRTGYQYN